MNLLTFVEDVTREIGRTKCNILFTTGTNAGNAVAAAAKTNLKVTESYSLIVNW